MTQKESEDELASIGELAEKAELRLVPEKSRYLYYKQYDQLFAWMKRKKCNNMDETVMLAYMMEMVSNIPTMVLIVLIQ